MSNYVGSFTIGSNGTLNISSLGFNPNELEFVVGAKQGASSTKTLSLGAVDENGNENVVTEYDDHGGHYTYNSAQDKCIWLRRWEGGNWVTTLDVSFNGYITGGFSLTVTAADSWYPVFVRARTT